MMAWMSAESLRLTMESGRATYWSRSRQALWRKGDESGNTQVVKSISRDCDSDALLLQVAQGGPACHAGLRSCLTPIELISSLSSRSHDGRERQRCLHACQRASRWADCSRSVGFAHLASRRRVIPVVRRLLADMHTPVGLY